MSESMLILVVDDNIDDLKLVKDYLLLQGFRVIEALNGAESIQRFRAENPQAVVLDYVLPDKPGNEVCLEMKRLNSSTPVMMLSAQRDVKYKIAAFKAGCDDFMSKPCELEELEIRLQNILRKRTAEIKKLSVSGIEIDSLARRITKNGQVVELTVKEYSLLEYLVKNQNKVLTRNMILEEVWGEDSGVFTNIVDVYINYLRKKLDDRDQPSFIKTVRGIGYMIEPASQGASQKSEAA